MSIRIGDNFDYKGKNSNFERDQFKTLIDMVEYDENYLDNGHISYCIATGRHYVFDGGNEDDTILGKWRPIPTQEAQNCGVIDNILQIGNDQTSENTVYITKYFEKVDTDMDAYSDNPVRNSAVTKYVRDVSDKVDNFDNRIIDNSNSISTINDELVNVTNNVNANTSSIETINDNISDINQSITSQESSISTINDKIKWLEDNKLSVVNNNISLIETGDSGESKVTILPELSVNDYIVFIDNRSAPVTNSDSLYITIKNDYIRNIFNNINLFNNGIRHMTIMIQSNTALNTARLLIESIDDTPQSLQPDGYNSKQVDDVEFIYNINDLASGSEPSIPRILKFELTCINYENIKRVIFRYINK